MDDELRRLGREARAAVERSVDADLALDELRARTASGSMSGSMSGASDDERSAARWVVTLAAAAAAAAVLTGALLVLTRGDAGDLTVTTQPTTVTSAPVPSSTIAPPTTAASDATTTTSNATTSTTTTASTTSAPDTTAAPVVPGGGWPTEASRIEHGCPPNDAVGCVRLTAAPDGTTISYDPSTRTLTAHAVPPVSATLPGTWTDPFVVLAGPDGVVYVDVQSPGIDDPVGDLVAVSLAAGDAGREIRRWSAATDRSGDTDLVAAPAGIVAVACCDGAPIRPAPDSEPSFPWVDRSGNEITNPIPYLQLHADTMQIQRDAVLWETGVDPATLLLRGLPRMVATFDGGFMAELTGLDGAVTVVRGYADGTTSQIVLARAPDLLEPTGVFLDVGDDDSGRFRRNDAFAPAPTGWDGRLEIDLDTWTVTAPGLDDHLDAADPGWESDPIAFANAITGKPALNESRSVRVLADDSRTVVVEVVTTNFFDDSVAGSRHRLTLGRGDEVVGLRLLSGDYATVCQPGRGHQDFAPALCV